MNGRYLWHYEEADVPVHEHIRALSGIVHGFWREERPLALTMIQYMANLRLPHGTPYVVVFRDAFDFGRTDSLSWHTYLGAPERVTGEYDGQKVPVYYAGEAV